MAKTVKKSDKEIKFTGLEAEYQNRFAHAYPDARKPRVRYEKGWVILNGVKMRLDMFAERVLLLPKVDCQYIHRENWKELEPKDYENFPTKFIIRIPVPQYLGMGYELKPDMIVYDGKSIYNARLVRYDKTRNVWIAKDARTKEFPVSMWGMTIDIEVTPTKKP